MSSELGRLMFEPRVRGRRVVTVALVCGSFPTERELRAQKALRSFPRKRMRLIPMRLIPCRCLQAVETPARTFR